jgi:hypothetical protein
VAQLEGENEAMALEVVELSKGLQEPKDSEEDARTLHRHHVQIFREFSARLMEGAYRLGITGLNLPTISEDDGLILHFFGLLADKLVDTAAKVTKLINTECRELLGLAGTRIFSNI